MIFPPRTDRLVQLRDVVQCHVSERKATDYKRFVEKPYMAYIRATTHMRHFGADSTTMHILTHINLHKVPESPKCLCLELK